PAVQGALLREGVAALSDRTYAETHRGCFCGAKDQAEDPTRFHPAHLPAPCTVPGCDCRAEKPKP
ncbi:MAG: hypothetical protein OK454_11895, partial [Thaumarchaeota archaeon]|nr:hypothetical protein [Nitrososphaerota archaeon]